MGNPTELEYEKQFQADLEKATALSLETLALEQFKRNKLGYSQVDSGYTSSIQNVTQDHLSHISKQRPRPGSFNAISSSLSGGATSGSQSSSSSIVPPPSVSSRRHSEIGKSLTTSASMEAMPNESDLISFTSPTSQPAPPPKPEDEAHSNFVQLVDKMHQMNVQLQHHHATDPISRVKQFRSNSIATSYGFQNSPAGMQLMPYNYNQAMINSGQYSMGPQQSQSAGAVPLTSEQLNKLYNMPKYGTLPSGAMGIPPYQQYPHHQQLQNPALVPDANRNTNVPALNSSLSQNNFMPYPITTPPPSGVNNFHSTPPILGQPQPQPHSFHPQTSLNSGNYQGGQSNTVFPQQSSQSVLNVQNPESALVLVPKQQQQSQKPFRDHTPSPTVALPFVSPLAQSSSAPSIGSHSSSYNKSANDSSSRTATKNLNDDLIDLGHGIDNHTLNKVSVLEAFDPLLMGNTSFNDFDDKGDNVSECTNSYYSEYDPFDYLYSGGTQYSDPVYEAVIKTDRTPLSPGGGPPIGWNIPPSSIGWNIPSVVNQPDQNIKNYNGSSVTTPPPLPPRNFESITTKNDGTCSNYSAPSSPYSNHQVLDRRKTPTKLYQNVLIKKTYEGELMAFYQMVVNVRLQYKHDNVISNVGHVVASEFESSYSDTTSIKLLVHPAMESLNQEAVIYSEAKNRMSSIEGTSLNNGKGQISGYGPPVVFTCDISTTVEHVIMHVFCELEGQIVGNVTDFVLKPIGVMEWLSPKSKLSQLECIHNSIKLERDVQLGLCPKAAANMRSIARTLQDDLRDAELKPADILAHEPVSSLSYDTLMILLETLEAEIDRLEMAASDSNPHTVLTCSGVIQAVKAICALLGSIDTFDISESITELMNACTTGQAAYSYKENNYSGNKMDILSESGDYAQVKLRPRTVPEQITYRCHRVRDAVQHLLEIYSNAFRVDFCVNSVDYVSSPIPISSVTEPIMVHVMNLHRIPPAWKHEDYILGAQIYHGTRYIGDAIVTQCSNELSGIYPRLTFNSWLNFESIPVCTLPRESRLIFVLYGCVTETPDGASGGGGNENNPNRDSSSTNVQERKVVKVELGWASIQFFDFERTMVQGSFLLSLWPPTTDKYLGPAPAKGTHPHGDTYPVLGIEIPNYGGRIVFPEPMKNPPQCPRFDFYSLDRNLQEELIDTAEQGYPSALDKREVFWEKRHYLHRLPHALPKILHSAHSWDFASLVDLHALLRTWSPLTPLQALELLLPRYPDMEVRAYAVKWIAAMKNDQLVDFLPQLLQALKHDTFEASPMARFLLERSLESPRVAHHLYWLLVHSLPGDSPQNTIEFSQTNDDDQSMITQARYHRRNQMMLRALLATCGEKLSARFLAQNMVCKSLADAAQNVKLAKESMRQKTLVQGMEIVNQILMERPTSLPLGPGYEVTGVSSRNCSYFNSNTLPLKINFLASDGALMPAIFKCGDDLQQDMLTLQLVRIMDKLWLKEGLDLKMVTFDCVPTGHKKGMIELVSDAETLRKIQVEWGLTGSFKDKPIAEWLAKQNPSQLEYQRAVDNFTVSCAGYSVATYILGICDRHNDNIMLKTSGHLFHIDFGKFLGDAQMFGNFKRDRTPFVLTSDMAYVINGGDRPSTKFHHFVDLCCQAFNIVRKHGDLILHLLALMATSGIPGVTADAVTYVRRALLPGQSNPEAAASFAKMIHISLKSWFTQFNFFLHNLAQMRFSADEGNGELLSFVPRTYTMAQDGRLKSVTVHGFQKRYDLEKYYTYILKVTRQNQPDPAYLFRSYKEFLEFHQKLCLHFPLAKLHSLPSGIHVGRSNVKTVAERRLPEIRQFLISLFNSADEIAHSNLVYTFFHPLLRDQQEADIHVAKVKEIRPANPTERVCGEIKLSLQYHRGALTVMVHHARSLPVTTSGQEPNTYVKVYLKPDPLKATKRKTKVVRKNCFPSFMETLEYRMPWDFIHSRVLQVTIWSHDSLQENEFLGGVELQLNALELRREIIQWFPLGYLPRS